MLLKTPLDDFHIIPINDLKEHLRNQNCWCNPEVKEDFPPYLVIHNSLDKREYCEIDNPKNKLIKT